MCQRLSNQEFFDENTNVVSKEIIGLDGMDESNQPFDNPRFKLQVFTVNQTWSVSDGAVQKGTTYFSSESITQHQIF